MHLEMRYYLVRTGLRVYVMYRKNAWKDARNA